MTAGHEVKVWFSTTGWAALTELLPDAKALKGIGPEDYLGEFLGWLALDVISSSSPDCMEAVGRALHNADGWNGVDLV